MAITTRYATNTALQYNESSLSDYLIADNVTGKKFLTKSPSKRYINPAEASILSFLINDASFNASLLRQFKDDSGAVIYEELLRLTSLVGIHNSIPVNFTDSYVPALAKEQCVSIVSNLNGITNGTFEGGTGNDFADWDKTIPSKTNYLLYSQDLNESPWNPSFTIGIDATTAPDGTMTADKIREEACTDCYFNVSQPLDLFSDSFTFSIYLKASERTKAFLMFQDVSANTFYTWFDLVAGDVLSNQNDSASIDDVGNGWFRCSITNSLDLSLGAFVFVSPTTADNVELYNGVNDYGVFAWGGQLETGGIVTSYKPTTSAPVTANEGSIAQAQRTNLLLRSQEFESGTWTKLNTSITTNSIIAPDGTTTADKLIANPTNGVHLAIQSTTNTAIVWTFSVYAKASGYDRLIMYVASTNYVGFNLTSGIVESTLGTNITSANIESAGNGWYRCSITSTSTNTGSAVALGVYNSAFLNGNIDPIFEGDNISGIAIWGAQLERERNTPSTYIPTTTTAVTVADGRNGTRAPRFNSFMLLPVSLGQPLTLTAGTMYKVSFWAKAYEGFPTVQVTDENGEEYGTINITSQEYQYHAITFEAVGTDIRFDATSENASFAIDDVVLRVAENRYITEEKCYLLDDDCGSYAYELNWLNKLGGRDTWVFTGYPIEQVEVKRNNEIEYSRRTNSTAPNRIYGYRENKSRKSLTLVHRCKNRITADWLRSELIDSIDVMIKVGTDYYPANVQAASVVTFNPFSQDYVVRVSLQYAFDINVQTR